MDWIPVEERLPENEEPVAIVLGGYAAQGHLAYGRCWHEYLNDTWAVCRHPKMPTHWMPLPPPPEIPDKKDEALRAARQILKAYNDAHLGIDWAPTLLKIDAALEV